MIAAELDVWLREVCWPLWLERGVDWARGSFFEALDLRHHGCHAPYRRLRVAARQIFVFSAAHRAGLPKAADAVALGFDFLDRHAAQAEGGYAWRFDLEHRVIDATRDLYDHAFVLLAFASAGDLRPGARDEALALLAWIDAHFRHEAGGYKESLPPALPRRQNPHMHLLEALLACAEAFGDAVFLERASELVVLFRTRFFDAESGALAEFFDDGLKPIREAGRFVVEPGHHYEWVWLLHWYQRLSGRSVARSTSWARLANFAGLHGVDQATGHLVNAVDSAGAVVDAGFRLWPQTERLRAASIGEERAPAVAALGRFLRPDGLWHERRRADGVWLEEPAPASSLYHLTGAIVAGAIDRHPGRERRGALTSRCDAS